jgi:hypothetical protein
VPSIDPQAIREGEYLVDGTPHTITRTGAAVVVRRDGRWLGVLTPHGHEGARALSVLEAVAAGRVKVLVRCPTCGTVVTDEDSIARVKAGTWECRGGAV